MSKRKPQPPQQLGLFSAAQVPRIPQRIPPPLPVCATVTEQLPAELVAAGWQIVWLKTRYNDGWFYACNARLGIQTSHHIYVKHRGFKFSIRDIAKGRVIPISTPE
ncbi:hypothetical protein BH10CHL1_BH10CHL1_50100 [soil metagenome]